MVLLRWIAGIFAAALLLALFLWTSSQTVRGFVTGIIWDRDSTLECTGGMQGDRITLSGEDIDSSADPLIFASGGCRLQIDESSLRAPTAIRAAGGAEVIVRGGRIEGDEAALVVRDSAVVRLIGVDIDGPEDVADEGRIERRE